MERLTYRDANGELWYSDNGTERDRLHRLAAYEDTGLAPVEVQQMRWISVEERKPASSDNPILIYKAVNDRNNNIGTAWYSPYHGWIPTNGTEIYGITHWMPLPAAPKEASHD